jgi:hypothetical protein
MKKIKYGILAGVIFAILDVIPMFFIDIPDRYIAIVAAFINRFVVGLLIFTTDWLIPKWLLGILLGFILSLPDALITKTYGPILGSGIIGGLIIGILSQITLKKETN